MTERARLWIIVGYLVVMLAGMWQWLKWALKFLRWLGLL